MVGGRMELGGRRGVSGFPYGLDGDGGIGLAGILSGD